MKTPFLAYIFIIYGKKNLFKIFYQFGIDGILLFVLSLYRKQHCRCRILRLGLCAGGSIPPTPATGVWRNGSARVCKPDIDSYLFAQHGGEMVSTGCEGY